MTAKEEYTALIRRQDERHAAAVVLNSQLKAEVEGLTGITVLQRQTMESFGGRHGM